eukprot:COSAG04_NODE_3919_length_2422_cov_2.307792_3_plen_148_part_00
MVGPEDEAADKARQETIGPDVEGEAAAQAAYAAEMRRQVRAQGKIYELEPDYGLLLRAHTTYHFVVSIDYAMNYTENENLIEAAYSVTGNEQPWDASGKRQHSVPPRQVVRERSEAERLSDHRCCGADDPAAAAQPCGGPYRGHDRL